MCSSDLDVTRVFKLISAPWTRARFGDVVGLALRFDALTIPRPGMVNEMEWSGRPQEAQSQAQYGQAPTAHIDLIGVSQTVKAAKCLKGLVGAPGLEPGTR